MDAIAALVAGNRELDHSDKGEENKERNQRRRRGKSSGSKQEMGEQRNNVEAEDCTMRSFTRQDEGTEVVTTNVTN